MNIHGRYSYEGIPERESNRLLVLIITIGVAALMVLPIIQYADSHQSQAPVVYRYGNEYVQFSGQNAYVGFGNSMYPASWSVYQINPASPVYTPFSSGSGSSPLIVQTFSHYRTTRIENAYQNSAVMIRWNHNIRIAEVFSFLNGAIDASVAIKNMENSSGTFMSAFSMAVNHSRNAQIGGFNPQVIHSSRGMGSQKFLIGGKNWNIDTGGVSVSWKNEQSVFSAGMLSFSSTRNAITLPFGPLSLTVNETYSVDPIIRPEMMPRPPPGGGGGGASYPPQISYVTFSYPNEGSTKLLEGLTPITVTADLTSMGSYSYVRVRFFAVEQNYYYRQIAVIGTSYAHVITITWDAMPGSYIGFGAHPTNGIMTVGPTPFYSKQNAIDVYTGFPNGGMQYTQDTNTSGNVYNSSGQYIGSVILSMPVGPLGSMQTTNYGYSAPYYSFTYVSPYNSGYPGGSRPYGIFKYFQNATFMGSQYPYPYDNTVNGAYLQYLPAYGFNQGTKNATWTIAEEVAWSVATALLGAIPEAIPLSIIMAALYPLVFQQSYQFPSNAHDYNNFSYPQSAKEVSVPVGSTGGRFPQTIYKACYQLISASNNNLSLVHELTGQMGFQAISPNVPSGTSELNYFEYSTYLTIVPVDMQYPGGHVDVVNATWVSTGWGTGYYTYNGPSYGVTVAEPYYLAQYQ